jgi:hypothetical protein
VSQIAVGHLDEPQAGERLPGLVKVRGWVVGLETPILRVCAVVDGVSTPMAMYFARPDVAATHPGAGAGLAGFEGWVLLPGGGTVRVAVVAHLGDGTTYEVGAVVVDTGSASLPTTVPPRVLVWGRSLDRGGSQLRVAELAEALVERGAQVRITAEDDGPLH